MSRAAFLPLFLSVLACAPSAPDAPPKPHPVTRRRDRLNRQCQHAHGRGRR